MPFFCKSTCSHERKQKKNSWLAKIIKFKTVTTAENVQIWLKKCDFFFLNSNEAHNQIEWTMEWMSIALSVQTKIYLYKFIYKYVELKRVRAKMKYKEICHRPRINNMISLILFCFRFFVFQFYFIYSNKALSLCCVYILSHSTFFFHYFIAYIQPNKCKILVVVS